MNTFLDSDSVARVLLNGPAALLGLGVKSVAVVAVAALIAAALRRASASTRHLAWLLAILGLLGLPLLSAVTPGWHLPPRPAPVTVAAAAPAPPGPHPPLSAAPPLPAPSAQAAPPLWPGALIVLWALGAVVLLLRLAGTLFAAARLTRRCVGASCDLGRETSPLVPFAHKAHPQGEIRSDARPFAARILPLGGTPAQPKDEAQRGGRSSVAPVLLRRCDGIPVPMTFGWLRPVILLPADADQWPEARRESALRHELAHIRRRDWLWHTLASVACALYWPNPLVWPAARRLRAESERACDDAVLAAGVRPSEYAGHLLEIARRLINSPDAVPGTAVAMAQRPQVEGRLRAILTGDVNRRGLTRRRIALTFAASALALTPLAALRLAAQDGKAPADPRAEAYKTTSISNLRQIALGVIVYAQAHNGHLPDADRWTEEVAPFWEPHSILPELLRDPVVPGHHASDYAFNKALSGVDLDAIKDPSHTVLLFESTAGVRNAADTGESLPTPGRHENGTVYAYADGKVRWVPDGQPQSFTPDRAAGPIYSAYLLHDHPGTGSFTGRVRYADGRPAAGVRVGVQMQDDAQEILIEATRGLFVRNGMERPLPAAAHRPTGDELRRLSWAEALTGPDGSYRVTGMTDVPYNIFILPLDLRDLHDRSEWVAAAVEGATGQEGRAVALPDLVLTRGGFVTGTVTDAAGHPVANVPVGSYGPERPDTSAGIIADLTDAAGHYRLRVAPGSSRVYVADGHWKGSPVTLTVAEGETKTADFTVKP